MPEIMEALRSAYKPELYEEQHVLEKILSLWPRGCWVLVNSEYKSDSNASPRSKVVAYLMCHPFKKEDCPAENNSTKHGELPTPKAGQPLPSFDSKTWTYYVHDVCVHKELRGSNLGTGVQLFLLAVRLAQELQFPDMYLTAVQGAESFWSRVGMKQMKAQDEAAQKRLDSYPGGGVFMKAPLDEIISSCEGMMTKLKCPRIPVKNWEYSNEEKQVEKAKAVESPAPAKEEIQVEKPVVQETAAVQPAPVVQIAATS